MWIPVGIVIVLGLIARFGTASARPHRSHRASSMTPSTHLNDLIFWSALMYAFGGCRSRFLHGRRDQESPPLHPAFALLLGGATVAFCYILGTAALLLALPSSEIQQPAGTGASYLENLGAPGFSRSAAGHGAFLIALSNIGAAGAFLTAVARLPFVGCRHRTASCRPPSPHSTPCWKTPWVALPDPVLSGRALHFSG